MMAATVNVPSILLVLTGLITVLTAIGAGWAVFRTAAIRASMTVIIETNEELRRANDDLRRDVAAEKIKTSEMSGRLNVLVDGLADRIVLAVTEAWRRTHPSEGASTS